MGGRALGDVRVDVDRDDRHRAVVVDLEADPADLLRALGGIRASRNGTGRNGVGQMS